MAEPQEVHPIERLLQRIQQWERGGQGGPVLMRVDVAGMHGCPFFVSATKAVEGLKRRGIATTVTIKRAGHLHVPGWNSPADRQPWDAFQTQQQRSQLWRGTSPRVIFDGDPRTAMGATEMLQVGEAEAEAGGGSGSGCSGAV